MAAQAMRVSFFIESVFVHSNSIDKQQTEAVILYSAGFVVGALHPNHFTTQPPF